MAWLEVSQACRHSLEHVCAHFLKGDAWNMGKPPGQSSVEHGDSARGQLWVWFVHIIMCWKPALQCDQGEVVRPVRTRSSWEAIRWLPLDGIMTVFMDSGLVLVRVTYCESQPTSELLMSHDFLSRVLSPFPRRRLTVLVLTSPGPGLWC